MAAILSHGVHVVIAGGGVAVKRERKGWAVKAAKVPPVSVRANFRQYVTVARFWTKVNLSSKSMD